MAAPAGPGVRVAQVNPLRLLAAVELLEQAQRAGLYRAHDEELTLVLEAARSAAATDA